MSRPVLKLGKRCIDIILKKYGYISIPLMASLDRDRREFVFEYIRGSSLELSNTR